MLPDSSGDGWCEEHGGDAGTCPPCHPDPNTGTRTGNASGGRGGGSGGGRR